MLLLVGACARLLDANLGVVYATGNRAYEHALVVMCSFAEGCVAALEREVIMQTVTCPADDEEIFGNVVYSILVLWDKNSPTWLMLDVDKALVWVCEGGV